MTPVSDVSAWPPGEEGILRPHDVALTPLRFLEWAAQVFPKRTAVIHGESQMTYAQMAEAAESMAAGLSRRIEVGDRVAVLAPNIPELLIAHYGVPLAGGVLVALNTRLAKPEIQYILEHSGAKVVLVDSSLVDRVSGYLPRSTFEIHDPESGSAARGPGVPYEELLAAGEGSGPFDWRVENEEGLISINYTSGTTGRPKGVMYSHRGAYLNALGVAHHIGYDRQTKYLWTLPMFHCNGWCTTWAVTSVAGTHVCLRSVDGDEIWRAIDHHGITHLSGAPAVLSTIAEASAAHPVDRALSITTGGAPPSPSIIGQLDALGIDVVHAYGLTEVYGPYTICEPQDDWAALPMADRAAVMARQGVPMIQADEVRVVDVSNEDVPADGTTLGEVVMRGHNVALGYFRDEPATKEAFGGGWFRSGDLAVMHPDGYLELKDRAKDIIISGGENISSIEVENALLALAEVADAAVVGAPDSRWGERPVAFVVAASNHEFDPEEVRRQLREAIAGFKVPDRIIRVDSLPRTSTGKVQKHELRGVVGDNAPDTKEETE